MEVLMNPGPQFPDPLNTPEDVKKLREVVDVNKELGYVFEAITMTRKELKGEVPLIGFCGAPWTLFSYMIEGGGSKTFQKCKTWIFKHPEESKALLMRIADVCVDFLVGQVKAGAQVSLSPLFFVILGLKRNCARASFFKYSTLGQVNYRPMTLRNSLSRPSLTSPKTSANVSRPRTFPSCQ